LLIFLVRWHHRHLSKIDRLIAHTACLARLVSTISGRMKKCN